MDGMGGGWRAMATDTGPTAPRPSAGDGASLCLACPMRRLCIGAITAHAGTRGLLDVLAGRRWMRAGDTLERAESGAGVVFAVRSGMLKTVGAGRVRGFHFPGELVGATGLASGAPGTRLVALQDSELCALRCGCDTRLDAGYRGRLWDMSSRALLAERAHAAALAGLPPAQRVQAWLAGLPARLHVPGVPSLPVRRLLDPADVASYLGVPLADAAACLTTPARRT